MNIHHISIWTSDLEALRAFYVDYFAAQCGPKYTNAARGFSSYFLTFGEPTGSKPSGCKLEIMSMPGIPPTRNDPLAQFSGLIHFAISLGSEQAVDQLTARLEQDGYRVAGAPRRTGDGYYESVILDPDGNRIEITL